MKNEILKISVILVLVVVRLSFGADAKTTARAIDTLGMSVNEETARKVELAKAKSDLKAMGDEAVEAIMVYENWKKGANYRHRAVTVLAEIGTGKAQEALLDIALGRGAAKGRGSSWAAKNYVNIIQDKSNAAKLLDSTDSSVLDSALKALKGQPVEADLLEKLKKLLIAKDYHLRNEAAAVMGKDPGTRYVSEKLTSIIETLDIVEQLPDANEPFHNPHAVGTISDHYYNSLLDALSEMKGADDYLRQTTGNLSGKTYWCVVIARAKRGDASVKTDLYSIINNLSAEFFRCRAVRSLGSIGTKEDLPFLRELEKNDSFEVEKFSCLLPKDGRQIEKIYPVRLEAGWAIKSIEKKQEEINITGNSATSQ